MSTITKEQAKDLRNAFKCWQQDYDPVEDKEQYDMFGLGVVAMDALLASLEAEPVAWTDEQELRDVEKFGCAYLFTVNPITPNADPRRVIKLYTAPPAPVVPEEMPKGLAGQIVSLLAHNIGDKFLAQKIWNACRAAMLQCADGNSPVIPGCSCRNCRPVTKTDMRFVVCPECGNKRCPHANDHRNSCTGSNEPGQKGSAYPAVPQQEV